VVDGLGARVEALEEGTADPQRARARDGLRDRNPPLLQRLARLAVRELGRLLGEVGHAGDAWRSALSNRDDAPAYSLSYFALTIDSSAWRTDGSTYGCAR